VRQEQIEDIYELSPMQQGILFHTLFTPEAGVYLLQWSGALHGPVNNLAMEQAWRQVVEQHPIFRTSFHWEELRKPLQVVHRSAALPFEQHDWRQIAPEEQEARLDAFLKEDRTRGFELSRAPLMRVALIRRAEEVYQLIWSHHQLLLDGWSASLTIQEVSARYGALCRGEALSWPPSRPYGDYIEWLQQQDLSGAQPFWRELLHGFTTPTPLVVDRSAGRSPAQEMAFGEQRLALSHDATAALQALARQHQLTLNTLIQGAWSLLLSRYSGENDILFGVTSAGRPASLPGVESMVGVLINTLPLRVRLNPEAPLIPWLKALQAQQFELREYEYCPLVEIQGWSDVPRGLPLFESILVFENYPADRSLRTWDGRFKIENVSSAERVNYPLTVIAVPGPELSLRINYDSQRFDRATICRMLGHLQVLLEGFVTDPFRCLSRLPLLTDAEQRQTLVEWNATRTEYPRDRCVHELFEAQVEQTPAAVALVSEDQSLTYQQLNRRANQLAHYLRGLGVGQETPVALCVERSPEMVVALLAILKAGGVYVPLDPSYPQERLRFMLQDTRAPILLTWQSPVEPLPHPASKVVSLDADAGEIAREREENPESVAAAESLAYLIYTSGSTGQPKGVCVPHRAVVRLVKGTDYADVTAAETFLQLAPLSFDASTFEIWGALLNGGRLVLFPPETPSLAELGEAIQRHGVTTLWLTAGLFHQMVEHQIDSLKGVRQLLAGGDVLSVPHVQTVLQALPGSRMINGYGPTENTTFTCCYTVPPDWPGEGTVPIGRPIANTQVYVLDEHRQPVPVGVPGELYIGGDGLARGYLNRPELTAERFVDVGVQVFRCSGVQEVRPEHLNTQTTEHLNTLRLYRTGDRVRWLADGNLEFLSRLDDQVKIRGFRIELGEVEAVLGQHPGVRDCAVLVGEQKRSDTGGKTGPGGDRLVAYVVPGEGTGGGEAPDPVAPAESPAACSLADELRRFLGARLPGYMVPAAFVLMEELPLSPNGKVDRRALPSADIASAARQTGYAAPRTPIEEALAAIWAEVLGTGTHPDRRVGVHDNFFELGGHSLLATQVISRIQQAFQIPLPLHRLFEGPTVAELAEALLLSLEQLPGDELHRRSDEAGGEAIPQ
jgi:surfactin family lipopeptide synthetase C